MKRILIILPLLILGMSVRGQVKIGTITIPDNLFKEYILDCYSRPDTIYAQNTSSYLHSGGSYSQSDIMEADARVESYNKELERVAIGKLEFSIPQRYLVPRKPSEVDFIKWLTKHPQ